MSTDTGEAQTVFRFTLGSQPPLKANYRGARWNPKGTPAIYTSLSREVLLAEARHRFDLEQFKIQAALTISSFEVEAERVVDLRAPEVLARVGLSMSDVTDLDFGSCQRVGHAVAWLGSGGLLVPSARSDGTGNLVLFTEADSTLHIEVAQSEVVSLDP